MKKKGSLRRILPEIRQGIFEAAIKDRQMPRSDLADQLSEQYGDKSPRLDSMKKLISHARNHKRSELDKPWTILSLKDYPVLPEAIPVLLQIQNSESITNIFTIEDMATKKKTTANWVLSIREARWASQLYPTIRVYTEGKSQSDAASMLYKWAGAYAHREIMSEIMGGKDIDTSYLDRRLFTSHGEGKPFETEDDKRVWEIITDPKTWDVGTQ